jgi:hypothetical protein
MYNEHSGTQITITHSDIEGSSPSIYSHAGASSPIVWGAGNLDTDPLFVAPGYWDDAGTPDDSADDVWMDGNYFLEASSVCVNAGDNAALPPSVTTDLAGEPRIANGTVDMGAYEYAGPAGIAAVIDIDPDTLNLKSIGNWVTCYVELPEGCDVADIDVASLLLNGTVAASDEPTNVGDNDGDGVPDLMVKFPRDQVQAIVEVGDEVVLTLIGTVAGTPLIGSDTIRVINPGVGSQHVSPGQQQQLSVVCIGEGLTGAVTYSARNLPAGCQFDPATGTFTWIPTAEQIGAHHDVTFTATDGLDSIVEAISIYVVDSPTGVPGRVWNSYR